MSGHTASKPPVTEISQSALLRENARLRGDLLTIARRVSHDLRSPLGGMAITTEMIKEILEEKGVSAGALVAPIFHSSDSLVKIIERVSFILKASVNPPPLTPVKMDEIFFNVRQRLENQILKSGVQLVEPQIWPEVNGVASWLEVIWLNLLTNALQQIKKPTTIEAGWWSDEKEFRFWAGDNGGGVSAEIIPLLFQPFDQLHDPNARHGLGLSIVQRLVELQAGSCGYEPKAEGGSVFYFTLPVAVA